MLNWIKNLLGSNDASSAPRSTASKYDFSPAGKHSYTHGGETIISRPADQADYAADNFEKSLLKWLQFSLRVKPESHFGTNTLFWKFNYNGNPVELAVIGRKKNTGMPIADDLDWMLRVEEASPTHFIAQLETHFADVKRVKRTMKHTGKTRIHFNSPDLLKNSPLNRPLKEF